MTTGSGKDDAPAIRFSNDGKIFLHSEDIFIASSNDDDSEPAARGETLSNVIQKILDFMVSHKHTTPKGPSGPALPPVSLNAKSLKRKISGNRGDGKIRQKK